MAQASHGPTPIELTMDEAETVFTQVLILAGGLQPDFNVPGGAMMKLQALAGTMNVVHAMQTLGWRVSRPLREAQ